MRLSTFAVRCVQRRPVRAVLTLFGMTVSLALVVATPLATQTVRRAYRDLFAGSADASALEITAAGQAGFDPASLQGLDRIPGVVRIEPRIRGAAGIAGSGGGLTVAVVGVESGTGEGLRADEDALLDAGVADCLGIRPGQPLDLCGAEGQVRARLAGTLEPRAGRDTAGGLLVVPLALARRLVGLPAGHVNGLVVRCLDDSDLGRVREMIASQLPMGLSVAAPGGRTGLARSTLRATENALAAVGVLALLAALFVHYQTVLLGLAERRPALAVLRILGATRWQVLRQLLAESALMGLAAAVLAGAVGTALAMLLRGVLGHIVGVGLPGLELSAWPYLLALALGPALAMLAAGWPAWGASRQPPLDELSPRRSGTPATWTGAIGLGVLLLAVGQAVALRLCQGWFAPDAAQTYLAVALLLLLSGGVLAFPLLVPLLGLLRRLPIGVLGKLALEPLLRDPARTGLTAGVVFLSLAVTVGFGHSLRGVTRSVAAWYERTIVADHLVRGPMPDNSFMLCPAVPESVGEELRAIEGVAEVSRLSFVPAECEGESVLVLVRDFAADQPLPLDLIGGDPAQVREELSAGGVVLGRALAERLGAGDSVTLATARGPVALRVAGVCEEFAAGGSALYLDWGRARELFDLTGVHVFLVRERAATKPALRSLCARRGLLLQSNAEMRVVVDRLLARARGAVWALLALVFLLASLGTANTMGVTIREQSGSFELLRALGMRGRQVRILILWQGLLVAAVALVPGLLAGLGLAFLISRGCLAGPFRPDAPLLTACGFSALASALAATVLAGPPR